MGGEFEGYRYATLAEWKTLIYGNTGILVTGSGPAYQAVKDGLVDALVAALGSTLDTSYLNSFGVTFDSIKGYAEGERYDYTLGMLGGIVSGVFPIDVVRMAIIDDYDSYSNPLTIIIEPTTNPQDFVKLSFLNDWTKPNIRRYDMGSYLVRDMSSIDIPEPSTIALLALGLGRTASGTRMSQACFLMAAVARICLYLVRIWVRVRLATTITLPGLSYHSVPASA